MTDRDLHTLLDRAVAELPEVDFAEVAWTGALAERARRRRRWLTGVATMAVVALAVTAVQLGAGGDHRTPRPGQATATATTIGTLADGTAYAELPLEGSEDDLPEFLAGLPSVLDPAAPSTDLRSSTKPPGSVAAVYLNAVAGGYRPVVVTPDGEQYTAGSLTLVPTRDKAGNEAVPLGVRAIGAGRWVAFPQPGKVVLLDAFTGDVQSYPVPTPWVESVSWHPSQAELLVRGDGSAWTLDPWRPGATVVRTDVTRTTGVSRLGVTTETRSLSIAWFDAATLRPIGQRSVPSPVTELFGDSVGSARWTASGAIFDQNLTSPVIRRGNGPIYQGVVAAPLERGRARVLLAPENPDGQTGRFKGCCTVLGWADATTVLVQTVGTHGSWVLAWNVDNGQVYRVTRIEVDAAKAAIPRLALNVGWRY